MLYIGCRLLWSAWYGEASLAHAATPRSVAGAFRHGVLTNLANPKALALFASLFAVLVPPEAPSWFGVGLLVTVIVTTAGWYVLVAVALSSDAVAHGYRRVERSITAVTGAVFVGIGSRLAAEP